MTNVRSAAIIGSFRKHYKPICDVWSALHECGLTITSPKGSPIIDAGVPFVRFETDPPDWRDPMVQTVALHRILRADFV